MRRIAVVVLASLLAACSAGRATPAGRDTPAPLETARPSETRPATHPGDWRKPRYIPVEKAVARLARHVDVPVVLPHDRLALRGYRRWVADPRHLDWSRRRGETIGHLHLLSRKDYLWIEYGFAIPDGCGGREHAVPTDVLGDPALLWGGSGHSSIIWPVRPHGRIGRFGLSGSFEGYEIIRLAESMETQIRSAPSHDPGC